MSILDALPSRVTVYEVGPRDGLQNEAKVLPPEVKVRFVDMLCAANIPKIEVTSFVRPGVIPQLADAEDVVQALTRRKGTSFSALVPNIRGMERAAALGIDEVALFTAASETFSRKNTNASIEETFARFGPVMKMAENLGIRVRGYISTAFGCPYEGQVAVEAVTEVASRLMAMGVYQVAISDTIGVASPRDVVRVVEKLAQDVDISSMALHFHDTRGTALANVLMGLQLGISTFDSSAGGLGGCPYAPGAAGNLATEDLVYMLDGLGIETGVSLVKLVEASAYLASFIGRRPVSRYFQAVA